ncbi:ABC transporter ATP-binding protein [Streptomyces axinellae]|uniref:ABC transporter domain-containing protein n=1 Tax=Streptomyces axinellae TaxID=552788 RepID=A0ABP6C3I7_9ACTN
MTMTAIEAAGLGKRFQRRGMWALRDCAFRLPAGRVCAVVGPNGAGKSTLMGLAAGLIAPSEGTVTVLGRHPADARPRIGFVDQTKPLYPQLTVAETLRMGADLNPGSWDAATAERIVAGGDLNPKARIRSLSGGQRTRVVLAVALAKRPELLLLDEPMADLDPLARRELLGILMATAAEHGTTIVLSSHVLAELEDCCDFLLLIHGGRVRLAGDIDELLAAHRLVVRPAPEAGAPADAGPHADPDANVHLNANAHAHAQTEADGGTGTGAGTETGTRTGSGACGGMGPHTVVEARTTGRQLTALIRPAGPLPDDWQAGEPTLEELVLAHLRTPAAPSLTLDPVPMTDPGPAPDPGGAPASTSTATSSTSKSTSATSEETVA